MTAQYKPGDTITLTRGEDRLVREVQLVKAMGGSRCTETMSSGFA